jgi:hypothetical protein
LGVLCGGRRIIDCRTVRADAFAQTERTRSARGFLDFDDIDVDNAIVGECLLAGGFDRATASS